MQIEVWSDMVCPWCFLGKRRLEAALADFPGREDVAVVHRAFQLDPEAVTEGRSTVEVLAAKYGITDVQAVDMMSDVTDTAAGAGLNYRLPDTVSGNTADAHRTVLWAQDQGRGGELLEALFAGYFEQALPVFKATDLAPFVAQVGLDPDAMAAMLATDTYRDQVEQDQQLAAAMGAGGVPFFVFERKVGVSGAQPVSVFAAALRQAVEDQGEAELRTD
ncbi:MAG: DsbA family oxidoreductase [Candidatus Nanopelagicales bacterium]